MSKQDNQIDFADDRRNFFRVDDTIRLSLKRVPEDEFEERVERLDHDLAGNFTVMSSLAAITAQMTIGLRRIENRDPDLAAYLRAIDQKIEVIGRAFIAEESDEIAKHAVPVNLSAGGMCVGSHEAFAPGSRVEIRMLLFPSFTGLMIYGTVIDSAAPKVDDGQEVQRFEQLVRVEFTHIREQDRELLIRHLLRRQSDQLRERFEDE
jgi:hypothetical protein